MGYAGNQRVVVQLEGLSLFPPLCAVIPNVMGNLSGLEDPILDALQQLF